MHIQRNISITTVQLLCKNRTNLYNMYKIKLHKTSKPVYIDMIVAKWMFFFNIFINHFQKIHHIVLWGISPTLKYGRHPFLPPSTPKKAKLENLRTSLPPWDVPSSKIAKTHSFKETKDFITNIEKEHLLMLKLSFF